MTLGVGRALCFTVGWVPAYLFRAEAVTAAPPHSRRRVKRLVPFVC
jgi:hypothetical protein